MRLIDLPDERRAAKVAAVARSPDATGGRSRYASTTLLPASDKDVSEGRVVVGDFHGRDYPACALHGAMNRLSVVANIWRCSECGVGCEVVDA